MSVTLDIAAMYKGPQRVTDRILAGSEREGRALAYLMGGCAVLFIAQLPKLARQAHLTGEDLNMLMGASLLGLLFIAPLIFYGIAGISHLFARILGGQGTFWSARIALFWSLVATAPLILLHGLVAGFVGPGPQLTIVGAVWCAVFLWFWGTSLWRAERGRIA